MVDFSDAYFCFEEKTPHEQAMHPQHRQKGKK